jgi:hypothetical protein
MEKIFFAIILLLLSNNDLLPASFAAIAQAQKHPIEYSKPAVNFFEGALLGNGGMGVVVRTRPDAVVLNFGHNNVWDIRLGEANQEKFGTFQEVFEKIKAIPDSVKNLSDIPWYREYRTMCRENYAKPYPRPFPCGTIVLGFDRREVELLGHKLNISNGLCEVFLLINKSDSAKLEIFTELEKDRLWVRLVDNQGRLRPNGFNRIHLLPDPSTPGEFPKYTILQDNQNGQLAFHQTFPYSEPDKYDLQKGHPKDRAIRLTAHLNQSLHPAFHINVDTGERQELGQLERKLANESTLIMVAQLDEGMAVNLPSQPAVTLQPDNVNFMDAFQKNQKNWEKYWDCSGVKLEDNFLEKIWYHNSYFFNCAVKAGCISPGLFANWSYNRIGTAWHGDYHLNYNWQQPFWFTFSSNHLDKNIPYIDAIHHILPVSRKWAKEFYGLRGAFFPHTAYPVEMSTHPYPCPDWGWEVCETPWAVQGLWWHFMYSQDEQFLKDRLFEPIKEAVLFLVDYMERPEAHGPHWGDDKYHIFPTVVPELYANTPLSRLKHDCAVDLTLTKFLFKAFLEATQILKLEKKEKELISTITKILKKFPAYEIVDSEKYGKVFVCAPGENPDVIYNIPNNLITVFPGEEHGLFTADDTLAILRNSARNLQVEGGNDLIFQNLQAARLGILDLEKFKRQIQYCLLPNGTASDMVLQVNGRYRDDTEFDFMAPMGIWFENFSLPVVINECMLQSYRGTIQLFPNWPAEKDAEFSSLRTVGAFLVSASIKKGEVGWIEIKSEVGSLLKLILPWKDGCQIISQSGKRQTRETLLLMKTQPGENIRLEPK